MLGFRQVNENPHRIATPAAGVTSGLPVVIGGHIWWPQVTVLAADVAATPYFDALDQGVGVFLKAAGYALAFGDPVYMDLTTDLRAEATGTLVGIAMAPSTSDQTTARVMILPVAGAGAAGPVFAKGISAEDTSTGTTAGTTETPFTNQVVIPAGTLRVGDRIRLRAKVFCVLQNSTDTVALALALAANSAGLAASTLNAATVAAVDAATSDSWQLEAELRVTAIGAPATASVNGSGKSWKNGSTPAFLGTAVDDNTTVGTLTDITVGVTYTWSVSNANNQVRIKELFVEVLRPTGL